MHSTISKTQPNDSRYSAHGVSVKYFSFALLQTALPIAVGEPCSGRAYWPRSFTIVVAHINSSFGLPGRDATSPTLKSAPGMSSKKALTTWCRWSERRKLRMMQLDWLPKDVQVNVVNCMPPFLFVLFFVFKSRRNEFPQIGQGLVDIPASLKAQVSSHLLLEPRFGPCDGLRADHVGLVI